MDEIPNMEEMLSDLTKIEGLDFFWRALAMAADIGILTDDEREIVEAQSPRYTITDRGRELLEGKK